LVHFLWFLATMLQVGPVGLPADTGASARAAMPAAVADSLPEGVLGPRLAPRFEPAEPMLFAADSGRQRPRAVEYSDFYYTRLEIHRIASWATAPLFVAEYILGTKLYNNPPGPKSTQEWHRAVALGVAGLVAVNTVTGAWNLWYSRKDPAGRTRRWIHAALMFAADAGFVATGVTAPSPRRFLLSGSTVNKSTHRTIAIASMGTALASYVMMLLWKN
jgi:hypothetical protein